MTMTSNTDMEKIQAQLFKTCPAKELHKDTMLFATYMDILDNRNYVYKSQNPLQIVSDSISFSTGSPSKRTPLHCYWPKPMAGWNEHRNEH